MLLGMTQTAKAEFKDIKANIAAASSDITSLTTFGVFVDGEGTASFSSETTGANMVINANRFNDSQHGWVNVVATVAVEGPVKVTVGNCQFGNGRSLTVTDGNSNQLSATTAAECWNQNAPDEKVTSINYVGEATTLTITCPSYTPYIAIEAVQASSATVSYSLGDVVCEGTVLPTGGTYAVGDNYTIPAKNFTLYKEGYTLTGWTDGTNTYNAGQSYELTGDLALTPVFTQNTVSLADRTEPVTVNFDFQRNNGAPIVQWQNTNGHIWVTQATVNGSTIDVPMTIDTNPGKFNNKNNTDCTQTNSGTIFTIPSCKGATVAMACHGSFSISTTTIDGQTDYTGSGTSSISYTVANSSDEIAIVIGDGSYYKYVNITLPVVQQSGGGTIYTDEAATVTWPMNVPAEYTNNTVSPDGVFSTIGVELGDVTLPGSTGTSNVSSGITFTQMQPTNGGSDYVTWTVKPVAGLTFTPTKISAYIVRFGTDAENGVTFSAKVGNGSATTLGNYTAPRNNRSQADDKFGTNSNYAVNGLVEITLTAEQQAAFTSGDGFSLMGTIGVGSARTGGIAQVKIEGLINGTTQDVNTYTLTAVPSDEAAGSVNIYPAGGTYEEGTTVKLTATPNFGYHFVNWTDGDNNVLSTDAVYNHEVTADVAITANFQAVQTYELNLTVDGTNDYMVTVDPAPTVVNNKKMYEVGTQVKLTANQYDGLVTFNNWNDGTTDSEKTITMDGDQEITAVYSQADIIAGWDFYKAGGSGRIADFYAAENDADALQLINTETGATSGWLDKSTVAAGGYESFKGAAVNWRTGSGNGDVGNWHWQTKVNAEAFQDINVQFQMLYNYNAYQTYNAAYSLDGENWTNFGSITMTGAKQVASFSQQLPAACNNQANLYIRMIADKTSTVAGAASANDGNTLAMFFITGTEQLADDPVAPTLVSSVPAEGATNASATGKIVLTFDKKVQVVEGTTATLGGTTLTPTVSGKTITFSYKNLDYATPYTFTLPANKVQNLTGTALESAITINFTTMTRPTVTKGLYDAVVSNVDELLAAIDAAAARADKNVRYRIFIKNGNYTIPLYSNVKTCNGYELNECITFLTNSHNNVSFIGESRDGVVITNAIPADATFVNQWGTASKYEGIGNSDVFQSRAEALYWQDLTVSTGMEDARGRDIAIQDKGNKTIYKNVCLHGYQDTWTSNSAGLFYFEGGIVRGRTDYLCGKGDAYFNGVTLRQVGTGGYPIVPSQPKSIGWVFKDCELTGEGSDVSCTLGRPWGSGTPAAYLIDTKMSVVPEPIGWSEMSGGWPYRFAEYNSYTASGTAVDLSSRKTIFADTHENNPVLTAEEAAYYGDMSNMFGDWEPTLATEQAPVPTNVALNGTTLSWTGSDYALLYAIVKNGSVVDFTTEDTYTVDDATATWAVRAANEMGGLSEASANAVAIDLVLDDTSNGNAAKIADVGGQTVNVRIERTLSPNYYNTLYLPFAMSAAQITAAFGEGVQVAVFTGEVKNNSTYQFGNVDAMEAYTGYLVKPTATVNGFTVESATISETIPEVTTPWTMIGTIDKFTNSTDNGDIYYFTTSNKIKKLAATGEIKGLRAFMCAQATATTIVNALASEIGLTFGGGGSGDSRARDFFYLSLDGSETTGISSASLNDNGQMINDAPMFNLAGQRVGKNYKGVVIQNGKKVIK